MLQKLKSLSLKSPIYSGLSILINGFSSVFIYKVVTLAYGPLGVTLLSHFQNLIGLFVGVPNDGLNRGMLTAIKSNYPERAKVFLQTSVLNLVWWLIAGLLYLCFHQYLEKEFVNSFHGHWSILLWFGVLLMIFQNQLFQLALATRGVKVYALFSIASALVLALAMLIVCEMYDFQGVLIVYVTTPLVVFVLAGFVYKVQLFSFPSLQSIFKNFELKNLAQFGLMALAIMLMGRLSSFVVREFMMDKMGSAGILLIGDWQAAVKVSDGYAAVFTAIINLMYLPKIAEVINDTSKLREVIYSKASLLILATLAGLLLLWLIHEPLLPILYDSGFKGASTFLSVIIVKDALRFTAWIFSYIMFSQAKIKYFLLFEGISAICYVGFTFFWFDVYGALAPVYAELLAVSVFLLLYLIYFRRLWLPYRL